jgi:uncharacterized membrane protein YdjX (TVP38/TMEM64 family)
MSLYQLLCVIPAFLILITALARLNDIKRSQNSKRWWVRRLGLLGVFVSMTMFIAGFFFTFAPYWKQVIALAGLWGVLLTWMTTPGMPPWWKYIARNDPPENE